MTKRAVLIVDDEKNIRLTLSRTIEAPDMAVETAVNGEEALAKLQEEDFGLVLLDLRMPGMDGMVVLRALRQDEVLSTIPVIVVSAQSYLEAVTPSPIGTWVVVREGGFGMRELLRLIEETADILRAKPTSPVAREP